MRHEYHITFSGQVQGVFFRSKTKKHADYMGLKGTVCNLSSGEVKICLIATEEETHHLVNALKAEPPPVQIASVKITQVPPTQTYPDFRILY